MKDVAFEPISLNGLEVKNRFVNAAAADNLTGKGGAVTKAHIDRLVTIARGGVGLVITGGVGILQSGRSGPNTPSMDREHAVEEYAELVRSVHKAGSKIVAQLVHSGVWTSHYQNTMGKDAIGASVLPRDDSYMAHGLTPPPGSYHAASEEELAEVVDGFAGAAYKSKLAGFDAAEVHAAHDSLLSQFMSPITNKRSDQWGGSLENRCRLHCRVGQAIRRKVGDDFPILIKLGVQDGVKGGTELPDGIGTGKILVENGYDVLEVSLGLQGGKLPETVFRPMPKDGTGYFAAWSRAVKQNVAVPVILTGGIRTFEATEKIIERGDADMVGMCRPFVREPDLVERWQRGDRKAATCISCNKCVFALGKGMPLVCQVREKAPIKDDEKKT